MTCEISYTAEKLTIYVHGRCSYETWKKSKDLIVPGKRDIKECEVDFSKSDFIDSSGLGSLLALRGILGNNVQISLTNTGEIVQKVLEIANFSQMFKIV